MRMENEMITDEGATESPPNEQPFRPQFAEDLRMTDMMLLEIARAATAHDSDDFPLDCETSQANAASSALSEEEHDAVIEQIKTWEQEQGFLEGQISGLRPPKPESWRTLGQQHPPNANTSEKDSSSDSFHTTVSTPARDSFRFLLQIAEPMRKGTLSELTSSQRDTLIKTTMDEAKIFLLKAMGTEELRAQAFDIFLQAYEFQRQAEPDVLDDQLRKRISSMVQSNNSSRHSVPSIRSTSAVYAGGSDDPSPNEGSSTARAPENITSSPLNQLLYFGHHLLLMPAIDTIPADIESSSSPGQRRTGTRSSLTSSNLNTLNTSALEHRSVHPETDDQRTMFPLRTDAKHTKQQAEEKNNNAMTPTDQEYHLPRTTYVPSETSEQALTPERVMQSTSVSRGGSPGVQKDKKIEDRARARAQVHDHSHETSHAAGKRPEQPRSLEIGEKATVFDDTDDTVTPTQQNFSPPHASDNETTVQAAQSVAVGLKGKAKEVDIPAKRGRNYPAIINKNDPRNFALFSNPVDDDLLNIEKGFLAAREAKAAKAREEEAAADEETASQVPAIKLKTKGPFANLKNAFKAKEGKEDKHQEDRDETARARMEGYETGHSPRPKSKD